MKIGILGTGIVGQSLAGQLVTLDHEVMIGTRDVEKTMESTEPDSYGNKPFPEWLGDNEKVEVGTFAEAAAFGDILVIALKGEFVMKVINSCDKKDFENKVLIDISNPLDFSQGFPPSLIEGLNNTWSLGEELQKNLPQARVVKTLNTMNARIMVNPYMINEGMHFNFICGNDEEAKQSVKSLLSEFGWKNPKILDLGDISNARGTEAMLLIWARIFGSTGSGNFNFDIVK